jgi:hypothetical protein
MRGEERRYMIIPNTAGTPDPLWRAVREAFEILADAWPAHAKRILDRGMQRLVAHFEGVDPDALVSAAERLVRTAEGSAGTKSLGNMIQVLRAAAGGAAGGPASIAVPYTISPQGEIGRIWPRDLERLRALYEDGKLAPEQIGPIIGAARRWALAETPCRGCQREPGHCHECRREHEPLVCGAADRNIALDHLSTWLDEAWAKRQGVLAGLAQRAKTARGPSRYAPTDSSDPVPISTVLAGVRGEENRADRDPAITADREDELGCT